jgi:hypothetical protein
LLLGTSFTGLLPYPPLSGGNPFRIQIGLKNNFEVKESLNIGAKRGDDLGRGRKIILIKALPWYENCYNFIREKNFLRSPLSSVFLPAQGLPLIHNRLPTPRGQRDRDRRRGYVQHPHHPENEKSWENQSHTEVPEPIPM